MSDTRNTVYILIQHILDYAMDLLGQSTYLAKLALIPFNEPFVYICKKYALYLVYIDTLNSLFSSKYNKSIRHATLIC